MIDELRGLEIEVNAKQFTNEIKKLADVACVESKYGLLTGINCRIENDEIEWSATNGHIMVSYKQKGPMGMVSEKNHCFTFPMDVINQIMTITEKSKKETFNILFSENTLGGEIYPVAVIDVGNEVIVSKDSQTKCNSPNDAGYPSIKPFINDEFIGTFNPLILKTIVDSGEDYLVHLQIKDNQFIVNHKHWTKIDYDCPGDIFFNVYSEYLIDVLSSLHGETVIIKKGRDPLSPIYLTDSPDYFNLHRKAVSAIIATIRICGGEING